MLGSKKYYVQAILCEMIDENHARRQHNCGGDQADEVRLEFLEGISLGVFVMLPDRGEQYGYCFWKVCDHSKNIGLRCTIERIDYDLFEFPGIFCDEKQLQVYPPNVRPVSVAPDYADNMREPLRYFARIQKPTNTALTNGE